MQLRRIWYLVVRPRLDPTRLEQVLRLKHQRDEDNSGQGVVLNGLAVQRLMY